MDGALGRHVALVQEGLAIGPLRRRTIGWRQQQARNAFNEIVHIAEAAGLGAGPEHGQRLPTQGLYDKVRHYSAVVGSHPLSIRVEDAGDSRVQSVIAVI